MAKKKLIKRVYVSFTEDEHSELERSAEKSDRSISAEVRIRTKSTLKKNLR